MVLIFWLSFQISRSWRWLHPPAGPGAAKPDCGGDGSHPSLRRQLLTGFGVARRQQQVRGKRRGGASETFLGHKKPGLEEIRREFQGESKPKMAMHKVTSL